MTLLYTTILSLSLSFVAWMNLPQNYNEGLAAHQAGDYDTALKEWRPLAEQGNAITQYNLALMYKNGEGIAEDNVEAAKWYQRAAEQGYASAQNNLGNMYYNGEGVAEDFTQAVKWYRKAAEQGHTEAQSNLGLMYENGLGGLQDKVMAYMWFYVSGTAGLKPGADNRAAIEKRMTASQIAEAQKLARKCMKKNYKSCGR